MAWYLQECNSPQNPSQRIYCGGTLGWLNDISQGFDFGSQAAAQAFSVAHNCCAQAVQTSSTSQTFDVSGNFTVPANVTKLDLIECYGGGSGGNTGAGANGGGGGGGGAYASIANLTVVPGAVETVTVGAGTAGGNPSLFAGQTNFRSAGTVNAVGGNGTNVRIHAVGGSSAACTGTVKQAGGNGGDNTASTGGGGGGSSAGASGNGGTGTDNGTAGGVAGGVPPAGGGSGGPGAANTAAGGVATAPGGGGGGGGNTAAGGAGANGRCKVSWTTVS